MIDLRHFAGHVPTGRIFKLSFDEIVQLVDSSMDDMFVSNITVEVCLIALVAYFESFCKNNFASVINICPSVLEKFINKRKETTLDVNDLIILDFEVKDKIGFIITEKLDFGSPKSINALYFDLLSIKPFSTDEMKQLNLLLNDRDLLVHHGGIYTMRYSEQKLGRQSVPDEMYAGSLRLTKPDFMNWANFIETMVRKILKISQSSLHQFIEENNISISDKAKKSLNWFVYYDRTDEINIINDPLYKF